MWQCRVTVWCEGGGRVGYSTCRLKASPVLFRYFSRGKKWCEGGGRGPQGCSPAAGHRKHLRLQRPPSGLRIFLHLHRFHRTRRNLSVPLPTPSLLTSEASPASVIAIKTPNISSLSPVYRARCNLSVALPAHTFFADIESFSDC